MSTKYFILTKDEKNNCDNNKDNQFIFLNKSQIHILPYINIDYYLRNGLFEGNLIEWCKQFCNVNKNMLDIGSHSGTYSISLAKYCNHIYSFEPQKMTYYALCGSVALSNIENITCFNFGLGSNKQIGNQILNIVSEDGGGSTLHTNLNAINIIKTEEITIKMLDELNLTNIGFIKIDVEGNEYDVILGGLKTLEQSNYPKILFESNKENDNLRQLLESLNYKIANISGYSNMYLAYT
jgi:FkbM family methyltransferase